MRANTHPIVGAAWVLLALGWAVVLQPGPMVLQFDGIGNYVEVPDSEDFSVNPAEGLTVSAWIRPDALKFPTTEGSGYVYWLGKGQPGQHEWAFRLYSQDNREQRANRISFYLFNPQGGLGIGSYFQDPLEVGQWIHVVGVADGERTYIFKNGLLRKCDQYRGPGDQQCQRYASDLWISPQHGIAPLRMGTRDLHSYFQGALTDVRVWNRPLSAAEVGALYASSIVPRNGLVAEYLLNEGIGTVAHDTAGAHDGTIVGAAWVATTPASDATSLSN
jgi:hypothetical protein